MSLMLTQGNALRIPLADESVHCMVCSPPYWGLRDYGIPGQLGLEPTPEQYVANMVAVFREVKRVLRSDGTLWLNLGSSYAGSGGPGSQYDNKSAPKAREHFIKYDNPNRNVTNFKPKDMIPIPWMVAMALQKDGWWLRSDIIWSKPNPMPESVTDRPTKSHEYLFLLTKSKTYFYDADAVREESNDSRVGTIQPAWNDKITADVGEMNHNTRIGLMREREYTSTRNRRTVWHIATAPYSGAKIQADYVGNDGKPYKVSQDCPIHGSPKISQKFYKAEYGEQLDRPSPHTLDTDGGPSSGHASLRATKTSRNLSVGGGDNSLSHIPESKNENKSGASHPEYISLSETQPYTNHTQESDERQDHKSDLPHQSCSQTAIEHSNQTHKTDPSHQISEHDSVSSQTQSRKQSMTQPDEQSDLVDRKTENNTSGPDSSDTQNSQKASRNVRTIRDRVSSLAFIASQGELYCTCKQVSSDHFATYPPALVEPCIKAGTSERGVCPECGAPWERVTEVNQVVLQASNNPDKQGEVTNWDRERWPRTRKESTTLGWQRTCECGTFEPPVPATVFDPFAGSGTTLQVARALGRNGIGLDLSLEYLHLARQRLSLDALEAWGKAKKDGKAITDLPMFEELP